jgi:isocitrate dehydrogenase kinase/phosphatase
MSNFPKLLSSQSAYDMAQVILEGFDKHYRIFRKASFDAAYLDTEILQQVKLHYIGFLTHHQQPVKNF